MLKEVEAVAPSLRLQPVAIAVRSRDDFGNALAEIASAHVDALFVSETMTPTSRRQLVSFAAKNRLPTMFMNRDYVVAGGLISYAPNFSQMYRHAATYVDKILKGARPGEWPHDKRLEWAAAERRVDIRTRCRRPLSRALEGLRRLELSVPRGKRSKVRGK